MLRERKPPPQPLRDAEYALSSAVVRGEKDLSPWRAEVERLRKIYKICSLEHDETLDIIARQALSTAIGRKP